MCTYVPLQFFKNTYLMQKRKKCQKHKMQKSSMYCSLTAMDSIMTCCSRWYLHAYWHFSLRCELTCWNQLLSFPLQVEMLYWIVGPPSS